MSGRTQRSGSYGGLALVLKLKTVAVRQLYWAGDWPYVGGVLNIAARAMANADLDRNAVLGAAAAAAFYRGDLDASERHARAAVEEGYPPDDPSPCQASMFLMVILLYQRRNDDGARHLDAAEEAMVGRDNEDYVRSRLQSARVALGLFADDPDEEIAQGRLGMSLAQCTGNPTILALASYALGWALRHRHPDEALAALDRSAALARRGAGTIALPQALTYGAQVAASLV